MVDAALPAGIVGLGRGGAAFAGALAQVGHPVTVVTARSEASRERADAVLPGADVVPAAQVAARAGLVFLTVPDAVIAPLAAELAAVWRPGQIVVHASGAFGAEILEPVTRAAGIALAVHPAMTFTGTSLDVKRMRDAPFAVDAAPGMAPLAEALAVELGGRPFMVPAAVRPAYHAALCHAANHLVTLVSQAVDVLRAAGLEDAPEILGPLVRAALENALGEGPGALTGPASRGDASTVAAHLTALEGYAAARGGIVDGDVAVDAAGRAALETVASYRQLARATLGLALAEGRVTPGQAGACAEALNSPGQGRAHGFAP
jgi:predicted short-subunit dehydrogenase-like oxidoreductase (DUF2520 family)